MAESVYREYTWGLNLGGGIGGLLNLKQGGADYSYLYDGKGNVSALIDSSQAVVAAYAYDPFGKLMSKSGSLDQPFTFSTKEYDAGTGQNYYGYRFRDSCSGRWTTRDPLGEAGGMNLYGAVGNSPMNAIDPAGLSQKDVEKIKRKIAQMIADMTAAGLRSNNAILNDLAKYTYNRNYLDCNEQTDRIVDELNRMKRDKEFDDGWVFWHVDIPKNIPELRMGHTWGYGYSTTSNGEHNEAIVFDPLHGYIKPIHGYIKP